MDRVLRLGAAADGAVSRPSLAERATAG
jgi:hypothetical protein